MCLITIHFKKRIATEDIQTYKIVCNPIQFDHCKSFYYTGFIYRYDLLYQTKMTSRIDKFENSSYFDTLVHSAYYGYKKLLVVSAGFHSALTKSRLALSYNGSKTKRLVNCTIPKGSEYYIDRTGLIVSNQIIIHNPYV